MSHPSKLPDSMAKRVRLTSCVTKPEAEYIRRCAADNGLTVSEFIHEVLLGFKS